jgi:hypothetical protein
MCSKRMLKRWMSYCKTGARRRLTKINVVIGVYKTDPCRIYVGKGLHKHIVMSYSLHVPHPVGVLLYANPVLLKRLESRPFAFSLDRKGPFRNVQRSKQRQYLGICPDI